MKLVYVLCPHDGAIGHDTVYDMLLLCFLLFDFQLETRYSYFHYLDMIYWTVK